MQNEQAFIHIVMVDIDPAHEDAFSRWYVEHHFPDLLACPGWLSAQRLRNMGEGQKYAAMYRVAGQWAFETEEFLKVKGFGPFEAHVRNFRRLQLLPISEVATA
jgi:hypothetical protein